MVQVIETFFNKKSSLQTANKVITTTGRSHVRDGELEFQKGEIFIVLADEGPWLNVQRKQFTLYFDWLRLELAERVTVSWLENVGEYLKIIAFQVNWSYVKKGQLKFSQLYNCYALVHIKWPKREWKVTERRRSRWRLLSQTVKISTDDRGQSQTPSSECIQRIKHLSLCDHQNGQPLSFRRQIRGHIWLRVRINRVLQRQSDHKN